MIGRLIILVFGCILVINLFVYFFSLKYIYKKIEDVPTAQVAIIPGAAILKNGSISAIFRDRVDAAILLYRSGKVSKILVSGDNSSVGHNEVNPVRDYLLSKDIPEADIYLDHAGFDTYSTMYRARDIFKVTSAIICTQAFHLPRAIFLARKLGIEAVGFKADHQSVLFKNYVREVLANEKATYDLIFHVKPKFLGEEIPIKS